MPAQLPTGTDSLPPLGGRLFAAYQLGWWLLLALALAAVVLSWVDPSASVEILGLRLVKSLVLLAVAAILFRRRRRDPVAAMLSLAFLLWTASSSIDFSSGSTAAALLDRFRFLLFAMALLLFPNGRWQPGWTRAVAAAILATFLLGVAEAAGLLGTSLYLPIAIGCVLAAVAALHVRYRAAEAGTEKQQLKWVTLGLFAGIALILTARAGAALTAGMIVPPVGSALIEGLFQLGIIVLALGFLVSLLRYRLYDAEAAISRSAVYAALTLALGGTFAGSEALIELVGQRLFGMAIGNVSGAVAAAVAAMMLTPLHGRISGWAEQRFQHDLATLKAELPDLLSVLSASASVKRLAEAVLPRIEEAVQATRIALLVGGKLVDAQGIELAAARRLLRRWTPPESVDLLHRDDNEAFPLAIPLRCPLGSVRAWLLLGPRPDGSFYGRDDLDALSEIAPSLQRALLAAAEREIAEGARRRLDSEIRRTLGALAKRVTMLERLHAPLHILGESHAQC
ncbi:MAG TPA: hypothetical protein VEB39_02280 [Sphingomicrobium sp.]|nr:hypothetical protein [Sphingomicrobium sp.]